jgi:hypothetical protein
MPEVLACPSIPTKILTNAKIPSGRVSESW